MCILYLALMATGLDFLAELLDPLTWKGRAGGSALKNFFYSMLPGATIAIPCVLWMAMWWYLACKHYLKLPKPGLVVGVLSIVLFLAAAVVDSLVWQI